jgi:hypothetical protein
MEEKPKKPTITKISSVLNWTLQNFPRLDQTADALLKLEKNPPKKSLRPINKICAQIANREIDLEEANRLTDHYTDYLRMAADQIIPEFYKYAVENQVSATRAFDSERFIFQIGKLPDGSSNYIILEPTYYAIEGDFVVPTFVLGWTKIPFDTYKKKLSSSIINRALLSRQDFIGSDARIVTFPRHKWSKTKREIGGWMVSRYANMDESELQTSLDRYNKALRIVLELLNPP